MIDKTIPYYNVLMRYDGPLVSTIPSLPHGYSFCEYRSGDEIRWSEMEAANNDFDTLENGVMYFSNKYCAEIDKLRERFIGIRDDNDCLCGSVICWDDISNYKKVSSVHWLVTDPAVQGKGLGTALTRMLVYRFSELGLFPIYLHTQPWSFSAIGIYSSVGFRLLRNESFKNYENQSIQALRVLKDLMNEEKYNKLHNEMI